MYKNVLASRAARGGFTLIELLTVIAIIGILASILIPVVGRVREQAHRSTCASNLRQIATGILTYESENGVLPGPTTRRITSPLNPNRPGENTPRDQWPDSNVCMTILLQDYVGAYDEMDPGPYFCDAQREGIEQHDLNVVYLLNRNKDTSPAHYFGDASASFQNPPRSLEQIVSAGTMRHVGVNATGVSAYATTELSQIWMISDLDGHNYGASSTGGAFDGEMDYAHSDGRNYVFFDGHVEYRRVGEWPANSGDDGNRG